MAASQLPRPPIKLLKRAGFRRCRKHGCTAWLDPVNLPGERCTRHGGKYD